MSHFHPNRLVFLNCEAATHSQENVSLSADKPNTKDKQPLITCKDAEYSLQNEASENKTDCCAAADALDQFIEGQDNNLESVYQEIDGILQNIKDKFAELSKNWLTGSQARNAVDKKLLALKNITKAAVTASAAYAITNQELIKYREEISQFQVKNHYFNSAELEAVFGYIGAAQKQIGTLMGSTEQVAQK